MVDPRSGLAPLNTFCMNLMMGSLIWANGSILLWVISSGSTSSAFPASLSALVCFPYRIWRWSGGDR